MTKWATKCATKWMPGKLRREAWAESGLLPAKDNLRMFASITKLFKRPQGKPAPKLAPRAQPVLSVVKPAASRRAEPPEDAEMEEDEGRLGISFTSLMKSVPGE